ncbi:MAG: response regulator [Sphingobium sp.]
MSDKGLLRILYVDDDDDIRQIVKLSLMLDKAIELRSFAGGAEAQALMATTDWRPDVVLLDVMMPRMDGPTLMAALRAEHDLGAALFIFVTARAREADVRRYHDAGAAGVILKPFNPVTLASDIRSLVSGAHAVAPHRAG